MSDKKEEKILQNISCLMSIMPAGHEHARIADKLKWRMRDKHGLIFTKTGIRNLIAEARCRGECILNLQDGFGYFTPLPQEKALVDRWLKQENHRVLECLKMRRGAEVWMEVHK